MAGTGSDDVFVAVGGAKIDVFHLLDGHTVFDRNVRGSTDRRTGITRGRLYEQFFHVRARDDALVEFDVQGTATGKGQAAGFLENVAEIIIDHLQRQLLEQGLHGRRVMDVGVIGDVALTLGPEPLDQLGREVIALALFLVAAETDDVGVVGIDDQLTIFKLGQPGEVVLGGVTVGCHAHDLELAVEHLEAKVLGDSAIQAAERIRVVELLDLVDLAVLPPTEEGGGVLALAVDPQYRRFFGEARAMVSAGSVRQVVLDWL